MVGELNQSLQGGVWVVGELNQSLQRGGGWWVN